MSKTLRFDLDPSGVLHICAQKPEQIKALMTLGRKGTATIQYEIQKAGVEFVTSEDEAAALESGDKVQEEGWVTLRAFSVEFPAGADAATSPALTSHELTPDEVLDNLLKEVLKAKKEKEGEEEAT